LERREKEKKKGELTVALRGKGAREKKELRKARR